MHWYNKFYLPTCLFLTFSFALFSCKEKNKTQTSTRTDSISNRNPTESTTNDSSLVEFSRSAKKTTNKSQSDKLYMLSIENCEALWHQPCYQSTQLNPDSLIPVVRDSFFNQRIYSIGTNGVQEQNIVGINCMKGECGQNQTSLILSSSECTGVLINSNYPWDFDKTIVLNKTTKALWPVQNKSIKYNVPKTDSLIQRSVYMSDSEAYLLHSYAIGYTQENQWPFFLNGYCDLYERIDSTYELLTSNRFKILSTNTPKPIAINISRTTIKIIWLHQEGICCPSLSHSWVETINIRQKKENKLNTKSKKFIGGLGQPCD